MSFMSVFPGRKLMMEAQRKSLFTFFFVLLLTSLSAQYSSYRQVNSLNSKLSSKNIGPIIQDKKGFIWIGTDDGLNRYDGYSFDVFRNIPGDTTSMLSDEVYQLAVDVEGNVWVGFTNGNLSYYSHRTDRFHQIKATDSGLAEEVITKLFFDHSGKLWVAVAENGLFYLDDNAKRFIKAGDLPDIHKGYQRSPTFYQNYNSIYDIYEDAHGLFWLATHDGLYRYHPDTNVFESIRQQKIIPFTDRFDLFNTILRGKDGYWLSSWGGGLTFYNDQTGEWKNYRPGTGSPGTHNIIQDVEWKSDNQLWVASNDFGFGYFDIKKEEFSFLNTKQCQKILKDKTGSLWVTSSVEGLLQFDPFTLFSFQKTEVSRSDNGPYYFTNGFYHDVERHILYYGVTYGDGLHVYNEVTEKESVYPFDVLPTSETTLHISHLYKDDRDSLWVLTNDYIYLFDRQQQMLKKFVQPFDGTEDKEKIITPEFYRMLRAANGDLWITSLSEGVYRYSFKDRQYTNYTDRGPNRILSNTVKAIAEDAYGRLWMINGSGVSVFNYADSSFHEIEQLVKNLPDLQHVKFSDLTRSNNGDIWITSDHGIYQYDHRWDSIQLKHWASEADLPNGKLTYIQVDSNGLVWFLNSSSLWCLSPEKKKIVYSIATPNHFSSSCFYIDQTNQIYLATYAGYNTFSTMTEFNKAVAPPLVITSFHVNNKKILIDSLDGNAVNLDYNQNSVTIEFSALDFRNSSNNKYSFMLAGIDSDWSTSSDQHMANYGNLTPGDYVFKVRASTQDGIWSNPTEIKIHVAPPFWLTWYFLTAAAICFVYLLLLLSRWRANSIRREAVVKSAFERKILETEMSSLRAQMNPHFIFNSLNSINRYILMNDRETASFYLTKFSKLIRLILENSKRTQISLDQEISALKHYIDIELLRFDHSFSYLIEVDPDVNPGSIQFPPMIIQPYVENSIWHGFSRRSMYDRLTITIKRESTMLIIIIEDNGVGRNFKKSNLETSEKKSHGLKITEDRLGILTKEGHLSSVEIIDLKNERDEPAGTKVIIRTTINTFKKELEQFSAVL